MSPDISYKAQYGSYITRQRVLKELAAIKPGDLPPSLRRPDGAPLEPLPQNPSEDPVAEPSKLKVCIVGAGVAGLYTARILSQLGFEYDLYEASNRIGGRVLTHYFSDKKHDYYDIGAMRFPDTPIMERTFKLFKDLHVPLKPYYMESVYTNQPTRYNDITKVLSKKEEKRLLGCDPDYDPFKVSVTNKGPVPDETVREPGVLYDNALAYYKDKIKRNPLEGFKYLMRHDKYSMHDYLDFVEDLDYESIHWLETLNSATGWFDQSFSETIMEELAFDYGKDTINLDKSAKVNWWCVDGGTEVLTTKMRDNWGIKITHLRRVTSIALDKDAKGEDSMVVKHVGCRPWPPKAPVAGEAEHQEPGTQEDVSEKFVSGRYATVINTTTLAALRQMDLTELELSYAAKAAIRSLHYEPSTKVGIKFKKAWWMKEPYCIRGGLGKTDMPLRVCVYPSYNIDDNPDESAVLLCSYSWGQDSERIAALVNSDSPKNEDQLRDLMLDNLARLHTYDNDDPHAYRKVLAELKSLYETHHAFDWSADPYSGGGAFALFGPGQFSKLYPHIIRPGADSRFHIVGEHASVHHAWIAGALNSAYRGVYMFLERFNLKKKQKELEKLFGTVHEVDYASAYVQSEIGKMPPSKQPKVAVS